jgi:hypothetical protein
MVTWKRSARAMAWIQCYPIAQRARRETGCAVRLVLVELGGGATRAPAPRRSVLSAARSELGWSVRVPPCVRPSPKACISSLELEVPPTGLGLRRENSRVRPVRIPDGSSAKRRRRCRSWAARGCGGDPSEDRWARTRRDRDFRSRRTSTSGPGHGVDGAEPPAPTGGPTCERGARAAGADGERCRARGGRWSREAIVDGDDTRPARRR